MPKITFIEADGVEHIVAVAEGTTAMQAALHNAVPGIEGACGGQAACATCHVFVDPAWLSVTGPAESEIETGMLQLAEEVRPNSRLACQITLTADLDGLVLRMPESQF